MDFLLDAIDLNEKLNFDILLPIFGAWVLLFWGAICAWVAKDALKRYEGNKQASLFWFVVAFVFGIPGVMFYLISRPEELDQNSYFGGGVNVPIANFVSNDGDFVMGLQLKINNTELTEQVRDMKLSIDWESDDPKKEVTPEAVAAEAKELDRKMRGFKRLMGLWNNTNSQKETKKVESEKTETQTAKRIEIDNLDKEEEKDTKKKDKK